MPAEFLPTFYCARGLAPPSGSDQNLMVSPLVCKMHGSRHAHPLCMPMDVEKMKQHIHKGCYMQANHGYIFIPVGKAQDGRRKVISLHRLVLWLWFGPALNVKKLETVHSCYLKPCANVLHLNLGTHRANLAGQFSASAQVRAHADEQVEANMDAMLAQLSLLSITRKEEPKEQPKEEPKEEPKELKE